MLKVCQSSLTVESCSSLILKVMKALGLRSEPREMAISLNSFIQFFLCFLSPETTFVFLCHQIEKDSLKVQFFA